MHNTRRYQPSNRDNCLLVSQRIHPNWDKLFHHDITGNSNLYLRGGINFEWNILQFNFNFFCNR